MDDLADLAELDEQLRRVGRDDEHVGMRLNQDAGIFFVGFTEAVAGINGGGYEFFKVGGAGNAGAVVTVSAKVGQAVGFGWLKAIDGLGEHEGEGVFAGAARAGEDEGMRKSLGAHSLAQVRDSGRVAEEFLEAHGMSVRQRAGDGSPARLG